MSDRSSLPSARAIPGRLTHVGRISVRGFRRLSVAVLGYNLAVIVWGAYVRASGSGAGCGDHWPDCNGKVIPLSGKIAQFIEFAHRATSGLAVLSVALLVWFAFHLPEKNSLVRKGSLAAMGFMLMEAVIGAVLVKFGLVDKNASIPRAIVMSAHLVNTFFLLASMALTVAWSSGGKALRWRRQGTLGVVLVVAVVGLIMLGVSGAITALGDTLFPAASLTAGMREDFSATANVFLRLRVWHPVIAVCMGAYVTAAAILAAQFRPVPAVRRAAIVLASLFFLQLCIGTANLVFLAPVGIQLAHLLTADGVWISLIFLCAAVLAESAQPEVESSPIAELDPR